MSVTVSGTQISFPDGSAQNTAATGFGFKNRIINGSMMIDQRNAGASFTQTTGADYTLDRWFVQGSVASKFTVQQSSTAPAGFINSIAFTSAAATSVGSGDYYYFSQRIEGLNVADLGWGTVNAQTVTVSFWVRSSVTGTYSGSLLNSGTNRSYAFTYTINSANTFEYKTVTIAGDQSGTWLTTNGIGVQIRFVLGAGSSFLQAANSWGTGNVCGATGTTNWISTNGATFYITGVQLEKGSTATSFDYRPYGTELALCQRYYELLYNESGSNSIVSNFYAGTSYWTPWYFKVEKRTQPTINLMSGTSWVNSTPNGAPGKSHVYFNNPSTYFYTNGSPGTPSIYADAEL